MRMEGRWGVWLYEEEWYWELRYLKKNKKYWNEKNRVVCEMKYVREWLKRLNVIEIDVKKDKMKEEIKNINVKKNEKN